MKHKVIIIISIMICVTGCALFGVFSWSKDNGKETIEVRRRRQQKINEGVVIDPVTTATIERWWEQAGPDWKNVLQTYTERYNSVVLTQWDLIYTNRELFEAVIKRTIVIRSLHLPLEHDIDEMTHELNYPEDADDAVYWFVVNGSYPLLGFEKWELGGILIP